MEYTEIVALAQKLGIHDMTAEKLERYEPESDGLSGGVSRLYAWCNRLISCHRAGVAHDWLYKRGGTAEERRRADRLFCYAAALSGKFLPGVNVSGLSFPKSMRLWRWSVSDSMAKRIKRTNNIFCMAFFDTKII